MIPSPDELFFSKEAADFLGITTQRLNKLVQDGKLTPLKKNASGTVFHIDELNRRKEELAVFSEAGKGGGMFEIDSKIKNEALNFATLMNALGCTEHALEPRFSALPFDASVPMPDALGDFASAFGTGEDRLLRAYQAARRNFEGLRPGDEIIKRGSRDYPALLAATEQAPRFLYVRGRKSLLYETRTVALVGSRMASEASKDNTRKLALALGKNGITVVSGLAKGIDVSAHRAALDGGFNTIAVIGTNLNQYYPNENRAVQEEIERRGLVVSQFPPSAKTERWFFPLRNGVMSGMSLATVVMEAGETSGALKQADFALRQGRQVIIPQKALELTAITWPAKFVGKGALVAGSPADVLRLLAEGRVFQTGEPPAAAPSPRQMEFDLQLFDYVSDEG